MANTHVRHPETAQRFFIDGGRKLSGEVAVLGAKNAALKMMAAALLTKEDVILHNVPDILDITRMSDVIKSVGATVKREADTLIINAKNVKSGRPDGFATKHIRASIVIAGPLLARLGEVELHQPGGCLLGSRPIDFHLSLFEQLGASWRERDDVYEIKGKLKAGCDITLDDLSVTTTENALLAAAGIAGPTVIRLAVSEPEIGDLIGLLEMMGATVAGKGTSVLTVSGSKELQGAEYTVMPDRIEAGTFLIAAAMTKGSVRVTDMEPHHLDAVLRKLKKANVHLEIEQNAVSVRPSARVLPVNVTTQVYPGFPTDLQAPMSVLLTQAEGASRVFETLFDGRLGYAQELTKMGAHVTAQDNHTLLVFGPTPLYGKRVTTLDLRAGATLVLAALAAEGRTTLEHVEILDRGYERIEERLRGLGAKISRQTARAGDEE